MSALKSTAVISEHSVSTQKEATHVYAVQASLAMVLNVKVQNLIMINCMHAAHTSTVK